MSVTEIVSGTRIPVGQVRSNSVINSHPPSHFQINLHNLIGRALIHYAEQLNEIRKVKLSRLVCDNSDHIQSAQVYVMVLPDPTM